MKPMNSQTLYVHLRIIASVLKLIALIILCFGTLFTATSFAASSNEKVVLQGRIVDPTGVAVTNNPVDFDIKIYTPTTGAAGSHCLLYEETQSLDMTNSAGAFVLQVGTGTRVGAGPTLRETFTNASVASFAALTCGVGSAYIPGAIDDRSIEITVSFGAQVLSLAAIPVKAVPYAFQANQIGGYGINNLVRLNGAGSATNLNVDQFNYLTGFYHDNNTSGNYADDYLDAQSLQIKNVGAPTAANDAATKTYVDTAISGATATLPALADTKIWVGNSSNVAAAVSMSGDAGIDDTGKLTVKGIQSKAVTITGLATSDTLIYNGTAWVNKNMPTCTAGQYLSFDGTSYSCAAPSGVSPTGSALNSALMWIGNASNLAAPVAMSGDATMANTGALTLASSGVTAGTYTQVTVNTKGLVTAGTNPTTLAGYGITDAIKNAGGTRSVYSGAAQPGTPATGDLYVDTTNKKWQRYNGATWDDLGTAGALTNVTASSPLQSSGGTTPAISFVNQAQNLVLAGPTSGVAAAPTFRSLVSADLPALAAATFWLGNASNGTAAVSMSGDASMASTGALSVTGLQGKPIDATAPSSGQILQYNGSKWTPTTPTSLSSSLTNGHIFMGNSSNVAVDTTLSGDVTFTGGATKVTALQNIPVVAGTPTANQVLQYNGTAWIASTFSGGTTIVGGTQNTLAKFNATGNNVVNSSVTDDGTYVQVTKVFRGPTAVSNASTTIDFSTGNIQYTSSSCGAVTLKNMKDGATYTLAVQGLTAGTCVFTAYSDAGTTSISVLYPPDYGNTTATYQTLFSFIVVNSTAYLTWVPGYHP